MYIFELSIEEDSGEINSYQFFNFVFFYYVYYVSTINSSFGTVSKIVSYLVHKHVLLYIILFHLSYL